MSILEKNNLKWVNYHVFKEVRKRVAKETQRNYKINNKDKDESKWNLKI